MPSPTTTASSPDFVRPLWRHRRKALAAAGIIFGCAVMYLLFASREYRSEGKLLVRLGRENATLDPAAAPGPDTVLALPTSREDEINSLVEVLRSRSLIEKVVDSLGADFILGTAAEPRATPETMDGLSGWGSQALRQAKRGLAAVRQWADQSVNGATVSDRDRAIREMNAALRVQSVRRSNVIQATYDASSPERAQTILAALLDQFLAEHPRLHRTHGSRQFFDEQAAKLRAELKSREDELRALKSATGLAAPAEQRNLLVGRISVLANDVSRVDASRAVAEAKVKALRKRLSELKPTEIAAETAGIGSNASDTMRSQLYALELLEKEYAAKYTEDHPRLAEVRRKLVESREVFSGEERTRVQRTTTPSKLYQETQLALLVEEPKLVSLVAEGESLQQLVMQANADLSELNANEVRIASLQREVELHEASYKKYCGSLEEARIDEAREDQRMSNISMVQVASLDGKPVRPAAAMVLALGLVLSCFGGAGAALVAERRDRSFYTAQDVESTLSVPMLASIPRFDREQVGTKVRS